MARRKRSAAQKLMGWSILAAAGLVIVGVYLTTHLLGSAATKPATLAAAAAPQPNQPSVASTAPAPAANTASAIAPPAPQVAVVQPDLMDQASRKALILKLINQGVFTGVEALSSPPKVGVTSLFDGLAPELKQQFIATVDSYINNGGPSKQPLQLIDVTTGKQVGSYSSTDGLKLL